MPTDSLAARDPGLSIAFALATRLCHDLAGTAGALSAALDMAADGQEEDALPLAQDCARELTARLRLLRAAFGEGDGQQALSELAAGLPGADRLTVEMACDGTVMGGSRGRMSANLLFLAAQALPRGGKIRLAIEPAVTTLEVAGPNAAWPHALARGVMGGAGLAEAQANPRDVGIAIICKLAAAMGMQVTVDSETRLRVG